MAEAPATEPHRVAVNTPGGSYDIVIGAGLLANAACWAGLPNSNQTANRSASQAVIVSNSTVAPLWAPRLQAALQAHYTNVSVFELPDGEAHKDWPALNAIFDHLLGAGCDRKTVLFALGGGVVGDITGFAAGCYMRGVPFVQVPTTLLAHVDSSVGGKTAINHPLGKNMIGLFYQPARVLCDLDTLATLPQRELIAGLGEVIKYGPIADLAFLEWTEAHLGELLARDLAALAHAIRRCCEIKAAVVNADEREGGLRAILNFGHTFGHAIESGLGYGAWLHGEAVGCGMLMATDLSASLGLVPAETVLRMRRLLQRAGLPTVAPALGVARYMELMGRDKKAEGGELRYVVLESLGRAAVRAAPADVVAAVIERATRAAAA